MNLLRTFLAAVHLLVVVALLLCGLNAVVSPVVFLTSTSFRWRSRRCLAFMSRSPYFGCYFGASVPCFFC